MAVLADAEHYLFAPADLRALLAGLSDAAFKTLLSRATATGLITRVCRGLYLYNRVDYPRGLLLFHAAARLRADTFNYISLETALSDAGVISQIPINRITLMSSGRSNVIGCGILGSIEFVHTRKRPQDVADQLHYDQRCHLWRATVALALLDMRLTRRNMDLIDWSVANESV
ncbi:type IV toxin-antitoxin system AbiEi family antitoxin domain-containing protein [Rhodoferax sp.]|uniref:type IV toxin-antitoxin system AbiEi family antitoxin n=1 Tax=Rhodoferax sp. TaxID=50421 RepID=UPI002609CBC8|nr:type IV toxin-antitoxin system AbiEi family antitoxin domain-containing protein [Rhodoferax sp.]MDD3935671.1 type IV toxin-antitoxin system AbiEi family antitoxin domain-containing protein [Rhodoferax sp.]